MTQQDPLTSLVDNTIASGYKMGVDCACDWLQSHAINYVGGNGITNFRQLYADMREKLYSQLDNERSGNPT